MELYVFDPLGNVVLIRRQDVIDTTRIKNRKRYTTPTGTYYGPINAMEDAILHRELGFVFIDTNVMINSNFIDRFIPTGVFVHGVFYPMSRSKLANLKRQLRK